MNGRWEAIKAIGDLAFGSNDNGVCLEALVELIDAGTPPFGWLGFGWELQFARLAKDRDLPVAKNLDRSLPFDLLVNGHRVQCKFFGCKVTQTLVTRATHTSLPCDFFAVSLKCFDEYAIVPATHVYNADGSVRSTTVKTPVFKQFAKRWDLLEDPGAYCVSEI